MLYRLAKCAPDSLILLPREALNKVDQAGLTEIRVLLHLASLLSRGEKSQDEILHLLEGSFRQDDIKSALSFWRGVGILEIAKGAAPEAPSVPEQTEKKRIPDPDVPPFYSGKELADAKETVPGYKTLVDFVEESLNKVLNTGELATVWSFLDYLKMPYEVVMMVVQDCCARGHANLRYISKAVMSFQDQGLDTYEKANAYFLAQTQQEKFARRIRKLFGLGDRTLTKTEDAHLAQWRAWAFSDEMLDLAYEKTVSAASKPSINYMHKILLSWHENGVSTPAEAETAGVRKKGTADERGERSYDLNAAFEAAVARQRKDL